MPVRCVLRGVVLLGATVTVLALFENYYVQRAGFEFVFHNDTNLLLTVYGQECYYTLITDHRKPFLDNPYYRKVVEDDLMRLLSPPRRLNRAVQVQQTSLHAVLNQFHDRLADFRCAGKRVFQLRLLDAFFYQIVQMIG